MASFASRFLRITIPSHHDPFGQFPTCKTEEGLVSTVRSFTEMTMIAGTSEVTFKDGKCIIRGDFIEGWSPIDG